MRPKRKSFVRAGKSTWVEVRPGKWSDVSRLPNEQITKLIYLHGAHVQEVASSAKILV